MNHPFDLRSAGIPASGMVAKPRSAYLRRVEMSPSEWAAVPTNPIQRDTEAHAKKAKHLRTYSPEHAIVKMAVLPNGDRFKLDGHTRSYLWERGEVKAPSTIYVDVFSTCDTSAVKELYSHFDSNLAVETSRDQLAGAARQAGLVFTTPMMRNGTYGGAVKRLYRLAYKDWHASNVDAQFVSEAVIAYGQELRLLDSLHPTSQRFSSGVIMAVLATLKRRGAPAVEFWSRYAADGGKKDGSYCDAVQAYLDVVTGARRVTASSITKQDLIFDRGVSAVEGFLRRERYKVGPGGGVKGMKGDNLLRYARAHISTSED